MKLKVLSIALVAGVMSLVSCTEKKVDKNMALQNEMDSVGYSLGVNFGTNLKRSNINEIDEAAFLAGLYATLDGDSLKISPQEGNGIINNFLRRLMQLEGEEQTPSFRNFRTPWFSQTTVQHAQRLCLHFGRAKRAGFVENT